MKSSCIQHPNNNRFVQLHEWQIHFCQKNHAAAMLLSHFSCWHDWKIHHDDYYRRANDIAEAHGDGRTGNENGYLFFTMDDLIKALMGLFGKKSISDGLDLLVELGVIAIHKNPNPRYRFDKTKYFKFYPEVCNQWLQETYSSVKNPQTKTQVIDNFDNPKMADRLATNGRPSGENGQPSRKNGQAITDTTNKTTNNHQSINARDYFSDFPDFPKSEIELSPIVDALKSKGLPSKQFRADTLADIQRLLQRGATTEMFCTAYDISYRSTQGGNFGIKYIAKVVDGLITKSKTRVPFSKNVCVKTSNTTYENDLKNGLHWINGGE
jgi:hypothetical protein